MEELARSNLVRLRERLHERPLRDPLLARLWRQASAAPECLRVSPSHTVLRVRTEGGWVLKFYHPQRPAEGLRRLFRRPPAGRELRLARALGWTAVRAEQPRADLGIYAHPWIEPGPSGDWVQGLAELHRRGWSDPDLSREDLIWDGEGRLHPVDLGHARWTPGGAPLLARRADLATLLAELPEEDAARAAAAGEKADPPHAPFSSAELLASVPEIRRSRAWRHARRCRRNCADFVRVVGGALRRGFSPPTGKGDTLRSGRRSRSILYFAERTIGKEYFLTTPLRRLRRIAGVGPARAAARRLTFLGELGLPAATLLGWRESWLWTSLVEGRDPGIEDLPLLAGWLGTLHAAGVGLRDPKPANFRIRADGQAVLVDGDGIEPRLRRPGRDLGRLLAEVEEDSPSWWRIQRAYGHPLPTGCRRAARRFRRMLQSPPRSLAPSGGGADSPFP